MHRLTRQPYINKIARSITYCQGIITQKQLLRQSFAALHKGTKPCECYILVYGPRCPGRGRQA